MENVANPIDLLVFTRIGKVKKEQYFVIFIRYNRRVSTLERNLFRKKNMAY